MDAIPVFSTDRMLVRLYTREDQENFFAMNGNPVVMQYIRPVKNRKECDIFLDEIISMYDQHPGLGRWAAIEKQTGRFIGSFAIIPMPGDENKIQIGYSLLPEYWGKGFAIELTLKGIMHAFELFDLQELYAITEVPNHASQKVLLKAGFQQHKRMIEEGKELILFIMHKGSPDKDLSD